MRRSPSFAAVVTTSWGLGESLVGGTVSPDTYVVRKADLSIVARQIGPKLRMTVTVQGGTKEIDVPEHDRNRPSVSDAQCIDAVRMAITLEDELGWPVDVECAWQDGMCYLLQCRPITMFPNASGKHPKRDAVARSYPSHRLWARPSTSTVA